jgi:K+-transporting ATPase KdpF subunit
MFATAFDNVVGLVLAVLVLGYLVYVLVFPERF